MPTTITGQPASGGAHGNPISFNGPADTEAASAASINTPLQAIADVVSKLQADTASLVDYIDAGDGQNGFVEWTPAGFSGLVSVRKFGAHGLIAITGALIAQADFAAGSALLNVPAAYRPYNRSIIGALLSSGAGILLVANGGGDGNLVNAWNAVTNQTVITFNAIWFGQP